MDRFDYSSLLGSDNYIIVVSLMILAGVVVIIVGFLGCCGSIKDNRFMLIAVSLKAYHPFNISVLKLHLISETERSVDMMQV